MKNKLLLSALCMCINLYSADKASNVLFWANVAPINLTTSHAKALGLGAAVASGGIVLAVTNKFDMLTSSRMMLTAASALVAGCCMFGCSKAVIEQAEQDCNKQIEKYNVLWARINNYQLDVTKQLRHDTNPRLEFHSAHEFISRGKAIVVGSARIFSNPPSGPWWYEDWSYPYQEYQRVRNELLKQNLLLGAQNYEIIKTLHEDLNVVNKALESLPATAPIRWDSIDNTYPIFFNQLNGRFQLEQPKTEEVKMFGMNVKRALPNKNVPITRNKKS